MGIKKVFYGILLLCSCLFYSSCKSSGPAIPAAINGLIDLRQQSFAEMISLDGQWEFFWQQLTDPLDSSIKGGKMVTFPFMWNGAELNGKILPAFGCATYRLTVLLPKKTAPLRIAMPDVYCAYRLFINGKQVAANGKVSTTAKDFVPYWQYKAIDLPEHTDTLHIVLQVANFIHSKGGVKKSILIGKKDQIDLDRQQAEAIDLLLTGCLFMGGLFFLGLYLLGSRDKAILLFSLYSMVYSYRIIGIENYVLHTILPGISWYITVRLEYMTLFLGIGLFGLYTRYLYPDDTNKTIVTIISSICFAFTIITLCFAPVYFSRLINPFLIIMLFCLGYVPYVYALAYKKKRPGSIYALISSFVSMTIFAISLLRYWGMIPQFQLLNFSCYISFFFLQSLILSHRVSFQLKKARQEAELGLIAKSEFLSTMSHEIRTPLNAVIGMSHLLLKNDPREDQIEQLNVMLFSANNLLSIVNDILDYNKIEAGKISFEHIEMDITSIV
ncbi:MAG TPA: histidine kinase dimerization/phospho-acceptor domain-containing protein, partial [Pedobacter sp.]